MTKYTQKIVDYCPQIYIERKDIKIFIDGSKLVANITYKNQETFITNMFSLVLFKIEGVNKYGIHRKRIRNI